MQTIIREILGDAKQRESPVISRPARHAGRRAVVERPFKGRIGGTGSLAQAHLTWSIVQESRLYGIFLTANGALFLFLLVS
jgi:hypothetical protein